MPDPKKPRELRLVDGDDVPPAPEEPEYVHVLILYGNRTSVCGTVTTVRAAERILDGGDVAPIFFDIDPHADVDELRARNYFENVKDILRTYTNKREPDPVTIEHLLADVGPGTVDATGRTEAERVLEWLEDEGAIVGRETSEGAEGWVITRRGLEPWMEWRGQD